MISQVNPAQLTFNFLTTPFTSNIFTVEIDNPVDNIAEARIECAKLQANLASLIGYVQTRMLIHEFYKNKGKSFCTCIC